MHQQQQLTTTTKRPFSAPTLYPRPLPGGKGNGGLLQDSRPSSTTTLASSVSTDHFRSYVYPRPGTAPCSPHSHHHHDHYHSTTDAMRALNDKIQKVEESLLSHSPPVGPAVGPRKVPVDTSDIVDRQIPVPLLFRLPKDMVTLVAGTKKPRPEKSTSSDQTLPKTVKFQIADESFDVPRGLTLTGRYNYVVETRARRCMADKAIYRDCIRRGNAAQRMQRQLSGRDIVEANIMNAHRQQELTAQRQGRCIMHNREKINEVSGKAMAITLGSIARWTSHMKAYQEKMERMEAAAKQPHGKIL